LILFGLACLLIYVLVLQPSVVARQRNDATRAPTKASLSDIDDSDQNDAEPKHPEPPTGLRATKSKPARQARPLSFVHLAATLLSGLAITAAGLRIKFRQFVGLGVFTNWYSALFLVAGALLCGLPQTSVSTLASHVAPTAASWIADTIGVVLTFLVGTRVRSPKPSVGSALPDIAEKTNSNVILAVIEDGIRDRIVTRMQSVVVQEARLYSWGAIEQAGQRTVDEEVAIGRLDREDGDRAIQAIKALRSSRDRQSDLDRKYRALVRLVGCCALSRLRAALAAVPGEH